METNPLDKTLCSLPDDNLWLLLMFNNVHYINLSPSKMAGLGKIFTMSCPQSNIEDPTSILSSHPTISSPQYITSTCNQPICGVVNATEYC